MVGQVVVPSSETQERMDRAWAWVDAAQGGFSAQIDAGTGGFFLDGECTYVLISLQQAGCRMLVAEVDTGGVAPGVCLERAEAELDAIDPAQRTTLLVPARAELRALLVRVPPEGEGR